MFSYLKFHKDRHNEITLCLTHSFTFVSLTNYAPRHFTHLIYNAHFKSDKIKEIGADDRGWFNVDLLFDLMRLSFR